MGFVGLSLCLSVLLGFLSVCRCCWSICLFVGDVSQSVYLPMFIFVYLSFCRFVGPSVCMVVLLVFLSVVGVVGPSVCLTVLLVHLSVCLCICPCLC